MADDETEAKRAEIIRLYEEGATLAEITKATGAGQSSIYWVLEKAGIRPSRLSRSSKEDTISGIGRALYDGLQVRLDSLDHTVVVLTDHVRVLQDEIERLEARLNDHAVMLKLLADRGSASGS